MSMRYRGAIINATLPTVNTSSASGVWTLAQQMQYSSAGNWPVPVIPYWYTTVTDSGASGDGFVFTTDGEYLYAAFAYGSNTLSVIKFDNFGNIVWQRDVAINPGGAVNTEAQDIALDSNGNIWTIGRGYNANYSGQYNYMCKLSPSGAVLNTIFNFSASNSLGGFGYSKFLSDGAGGMYLSFFNYTSAPFPSYTYYVTLMRLDSNFTVLWSTSSRRGTSVYESNIVTSRPTRDSAGNIYISGYYQPTYQGNNTGFVTKYSSSGAILIDKRLDITGASLGSVLCQNVVVDSSDNVFVDGSWSGGNLGGRFVAKLNTSLDVSWARSFSGLSSSNNAFILPNGSLFSTGPNGSVSIDTNGNTLFSRASNGQFKGTFYNNSIVYSLYSGNTGSIWKMPQDGTGTGVYSISAGTYYYSFGPSAETITATTSARTSTVETITFTLPSTTRSSTTPTRTYTKTALTISPTVGSAPYVTPGTYTWICPVGVTSVSAVAIGGGGGGTRGQYTTGGGGGGALAYRNNVSVTPGTSYTVVVGAGGTGGVSGSPAGTNGGQSSVFSMIAGGGAASGGGFAGGTPSGTRDAGYSGGGGNTYQPYQGGGAGGAAGYSGNGGNGASGSNATAGSGGGGGGGGRGNFQSAPGEEAYYEGGNGGGVGILGQGANGAAGTNTSSVGTAGGAGSGGTGTQFGGGGYGAGTRIFFTCCCVIYSYSNGGTGGAGAVRIVWGSGRTFPSTNVGSP